LSLARPKKGSEEGGMDAYSHASGPVGSIKSI
jgi:hypothetical protein